MGNAQARSRMLPVLGGVNLFSHLADADLEQLARTFEWEMFEPHSIIYKEGDRLKTFFVVAQGSAHFFAPLHKAAADTGGGGRAAGAGTGASAAAGSAAAAASGAATAKPNLVRSATTLVQDPDSVAAGEHAAAAVGHPVQYMYSKHVCEYFGANAMLHSEGHLCDQTVVAAGNGCRVLTLTRSAYVHMKNMQGFQHMGFMLQSLQRDRLVPILRGIPFFATLDDKTLIQLSGLLHYEVFNAGRVICRENTRGDSMHVLVEGRVRVTAQKREMAAPRYTAEGFAIKRSNGKLHLWQRRLFVLENSRVSYYRVKMKEVDGLDADTAAVAAALAGHQQQSRGSILAQRRIVQLGETALPTRGTYRLASIPPSALELRGQFVLLEAREVPGPKYQLEFVGDDRTVRIRAGSSEARTAWLTFARDALKAAAVEQAHLASMKAADGNKAALAAGSGKVRSHSVAPGSGHARPSLAGPGSDRSIGSSDSDGSDGDAFASGGGTHKKGDRRRFARRVSQQARADAVVPTADADDGTIVVCELEAGSYFGEISLVTDMPRTATVSTITQVSALVLPRAYFRNFLRVMPKDVKKTIEALARQRTAATLQRLKLPFLSGFTERRLTQIAQASRLRRLEAGTVVFKQGHIGTSFFMIVNGELAVTVEDADGTSKEVNTLKSGDYFGEIALLTEQRRLATVSCKERTTLLELPKEHFLAQFASESPEASADFGLKLFKQNCELRHVLHHATGLNYFTDALEKEYSAENVHFWAAVNQFQKKFRPSPDIAVAVSAVEDKEGASGGTSPAGASESKERPVGDTERNDADASAAALSSSAPGASGERPRMARSGTETRLEMEKATLNQTTFVAAATDDRVMERSASIMLDRMKMAADAIYGEYVADSAPQQINIRSSVRKAIDARRKADDIDSTLYDAAQEEIYKLMEKDNFARFRKGDTFKRLLEEVGSYQTLGETSSVAQKKMRSMNSVRMIASMQSKRRISARPDLGRPKDSKRAGAKATHRPGPGGAEATGSSVEPVSEAEAARPGHPSRISTASAPAALSDVVSDVDRMPPDSVAEDDDGDADAEALAGADEPDVDAAADDDDGVASAEGGADAVGDVEAGDDVGAEGADDSVAGPHSEATATGDDDAPEYAEDAEAGDAVGGEAIETPEEARHATPADVEVEVAS